MAGVIDSFLDFISGKGPLKKAEKGADAPDVTKQPSTPGMAQSDIAAAAQKQADKSLKPNVNKAKQQPSTGGRYDWRNQ